jgi:hypothetical protein
MSNWEVSENCIYQPLTGDAKAGFNAHSAPVLSYTFYPSSSHP